ncbi:hypothetical protein M409DRAFT_30943 [Zasmidium cellare ATCC 36951]|uniref:Ketoreductase domain-containing protein n=1 Tax=Zasmidium cellare ATCC 36951 TaxID=1080233 RepID=A0A6A6BVL1_ZASCE|nr:uncharacterized protein M409DRAFT_30943 [Zasmidium cellare ATCC 36951]KAF2158573.1 hypothetical protein M409DRAFT_30943 [Zasmidium cellare ATCC 36951]
MHIKDRTFVVSGGASGLGLATAEELYANGGYVAILDMNPANGEKVIKQLGDRAKFFEVDVTESESLEAAVNGTVAWIKQTGKPMGGILPLAGVGLPAKLLDRDLNPVDMSRLNFVIDINLKGMLNTIRLLLPHMARNEPTTPDGERGVIVMVSSSAAFEGQVGQLSYAASKGAVRSMTLVLARDLAPNGIRAMSIAPSLFETAMSAALSEKVRQTLTKVTEFPKRLGNAKEFAGLARHCIENTYLNGECIRLDGGTRMPSKM